MVGRGFSGPLHLPAYDNIVNQKVKTGASSFPELIRAVKGGTMWSTAMDWYANPSIPSKGRPAKNWARVVASPNVTLVVSPVTPDH